MTVSAPLPKSCIVSNINLLFLRKESYFCNVKGRQPYENVSRFIRRKRIASIKRETAFCRLLG